MAFLQREGIFRGEIIDGSVERGNEKSFRFKFSAQVTDEWVGGKWKPIAESLFVTGYSYVVKKDGTPSEAQVESIRSAFDLGDGKGAVSSFLLGNHWKDRAVAFVVKRGEPNASGKVYYNVDWFRHPEHPVKGQASQPLDSAGAADFAATFGATPPAISEKDADDLPF